MFVHVKMTTIWCLHMFFRNAHSHVQQNISVNGNFTTSITLGRCSLYTHQAPSLSRVGWYTHVSGIRVAFSTLHVIMPSITLFLMKPLFSLLMCACSGVRWLFFNRHTNQSILCPLRPFVSRANQRLNAL